MCNHCTLRIKYSKGNTESSNEWRSVKEKEKKLRVKVTIESVLCKLKRYVYWGYAGKKCLPSRSSYLPVHIHWFTTKNSCILDLFVCSVGFSFIFCIVCTHQLNKAVFFLLDHLLHSFGKYACVILPK